MYIEGVLTALAIRPFIRDTVGNSVHMAIGGAVGSCFVDGTHLGGRVGEVSFRLEEPIDPSILRLCASKKTRSRKEKRR